MSVSELGSGPEHGSGLELRKVSAGYGRIEVIRDLDLRVAKGETVTLIGPNGAGKSTLLAAITGTIRRRGGEILLDGRNLAVLDSHRIVAAGLALVPEGRLVFAPLSVKDNLRLGAIRLGGSGGHSVSERYDYVYGLFPRLAERAGQPAGTLSGGEQQMLAIGRALMSAPRVLLLDEPFLGLAPLVIEEIRRALDALREGGLTILLVEQKLDVALDVASDAYVMIKGRIALADSAARLRKRKDLNTLYFSLAEEQE